MKLKELPGLVGLSVAVWLGAVQLASAQEAASDWVRTEYGILRIVSSANYLRDEGQTLIGVQIRLQPGWKTYWRTPGEAGVPTQFDWSGSKNVSTYRIAWPTPQRFSDYEMETFGYDQEVIFPVYVTPEEGSSPIDVQLKLTYGVCKNICIPMETQLRMSMSPKASGQEEVAERSRHARHIERFVKRVPAANGGEGLTIEHVLLRETEDGRELEVQVVAETPMGWPDAAVELPPAHRLGLPLVDISLDRKTVRLRMPIWSQEEADSLVGQITSVVFWDEDGRSVEHSLEVGRAPEPTKK